MNKNNYPTRNEIAPMLGELAFPIIAIVIARLHLYFKLFLAAIVLIHGAIYAIISGSEEKKENNDNAGIPEAMIGCALCDFIVAFVCAYFGGSIVMPIILMLGNAPLHLLEAKYQRGQ